MNYGLTFQARADYATAVSYFERALAWCPSYWRWWFVESRMGASTDAEAPPRFPSPLIKPDARVSRIRLSDWLHR